MGQDLFATVCGSIAFVFLFANFIISLRIAKVLTGYGVRINYPMLHIRIYRYASIYKNLTLKEEGEEGPLYGQFKITNWLVILFLGMGILAIYLF
jgi:hypothetical protein